MVRRLKWHELLIVVAVLAALFAPYAGAGSRLFSGLHAYAENWDHNSVVFPALRAALEAAAPFETLRGWLGSLRHFLGDPAWSAGLESLAWPATLARLILLAVFLAGSFVISMDAAGIDQELFLATGLLLVLTPTLHPWYLLWIVPFAAAGPSIPWLLFTALAPLSYLSLRAPGGRVPAWVLAFEWGIPAATALWLRAGRWRRDRRAARSEGA